VRGGGWLSRGRRPKSGCKLALLAVAKSPLDAEVAIYEIAPVALPAADLELAEHPVEIAIRWLEGVGEPDRLAPTDQLASCAVEAPSRP
jgi:hypothetical protein